MAECMEADPDENPKRRESTLMHILNRNKRGRALRLIEEHPELVNKPNMNGTTPLTYACKKRMTGVALAILRTNLANVDHVDKNGETAMFWAQWNNMTEVIAVITLKIWQRSVGNDVYILS